MNVKKANVRAIYLSQNITGLNLACLMRSPTLYEHFDNEWSRVGDFHSNTHSFRLASSLRSKRRRSHTLSPWQQGRMCEMVCTQLDCSAL